MEVTKAFDPVLDDLEYIDMSGANSLRRASRNSADMEILAKRGNSKLSSSTPEDKVSTKMNQSYCSKVDYNSAKVNATDDSLLMQMSLIGHTKMDTDGDNNLDDTYVTICGSTYLSPHCESCLNTGEEKERTYMSIDSVTADLPVKPPQLPKRNSNEVRSNMVSCSKCKTAKVQKLSPLRPKENDVLMAGDHKYTVQQIFDSVDKLTRDLHDDAKINSLKELPSQSKCRDSGFFDFAKPNYSYNTSVNILDEAMCERTTENFIFGTNSILRCKSKKPLTAGGSRRTYPYARNQSNYSTDTYDTFQAVSTTAYTHECILEEYSYVSTPSPRDDVKLPLKTKKTKRRRSFLDHLGSVSSIMSSKSSRPRLYSISDHSIVSKKSSPFKKNSFLRSSVKSFKRDTLIDSNNNTRTVYGESGSHYGFVNSNSRETCC